MKRYIPALLAALICTGAVSCAFRTDNTGAVSDTAAATETEPYSSGTETAEEEKNTAQNKADGEGGKKIFHNDARFPEII